MRIEQNNANNPSESRGDSGQLLIEAAVGAGIILVALTGILALTANALGLNKVVTEQYIAANLAAEGIELTKNFIDNNIFRREYGGEKDTLPWKDGLDPSDPSDTTKDFYQMDFNDGSPTHIENTGDPLYSPLRLAPVSGAYVYEDTFDPGGANEKTAPTKFFRKIEIGVYSDRDGTTNDDDVILVHSFVEWTGRGGARNQIHLEDHFFYWQQF